MTKQFLPSKHGHTLDDANMTMLVEPMPGTQVIYEHITDCSDDFTKVYPPNTTLVVHNRCPINLELLGEVTKLVVDYNPLGSILYCGDYSKPSFTREVVVN